MADLHPEFSEREHLSSLRSDQVFGTTSYSYLSALGDYESHVWVRKAIQVIMNNVSVLPLLVRRGDEVTDDHDLLRLLTNVNEQMSSQDLWQQWIVDMMLGGEEGWELIRGKGGKYVEIWPRQPHVIQITPDQSLRRYFKVLHYTIDDGQSAPYSLQPDEFVHFKFFNPRNPWRGIAPITAVRTSIVIDVYAQAWSKFFFKKSARPDYAIIAPQGITKTEREEMELLLAAKFGGVEQSHKPIVLEQGITDIKLLDFRPRDLEWVQQRGLSREEIGATFGIPDEIMGWGRDTYENFDTAHWVLWSLTLVPLTMFRDSHLTEYFRRLGILLPDEFLFTDLSSVGALKKDLKTKVEMLDILARWGYPINTASAFLGLGLPMLRGGDVGYLPLSLIPVTREEGKAIAGLGKGQRRFPQIRAMEFGSEEHARAWDSFVKRTDPYEKKLGETVAGLMQRQQLEVLARLRAEAKSKDLGDVARNPFDRGEWEDNFSEGVHPVLRDVVGAAGQNALDDLALAISFDVLDPRVLRFLKAREQRFAEEVNQTTWERLKDSLSEGMGEGESIGDLAARVEDVMGDRIRSSGETIARTEVIGASNGGTLLAWDQSEVVDEKEWLAALDERTRETHAEAHGQTVKLSGNFKVGAGRGPAPGQIGLAEEDINCRCTMTAVLGKQSPRILASGNGHGRLAPITAR